MINGETGMKKVDTEIEAVQALKPLNPFITLETLEADFVVHGPRWSPVRI